jgi:hypothetical protein
MLQELGLTAEDINVISASALRNRAQDAKNYINELYEECRQYKRKEIEKLNMHQLICLRTLKTILNLLPNLVLQQQRLQ